MFFTDRQLKVLGFVHSHTQAHGHAPTLQEIATHFGFSKVTALGHLRALEKKRAIRRSRHQARSIELVDVPSREHVTPTKLPITGELKAGNELSYVAQEDEIDLASLIPTEKNGHVLRVVGDSYKGDGILDGDLLIIEPRGLPAAGELVLLATDRSRALLVRYSDKPTPRASLSDGTQLPVESSQIRGVVRALLRVPAHSRRAGAG